MAERSSPCCPASPRDELPRVTMRLEVLLPVAPDLVQPRLVVTHRGVVGRRGEVGIEQRPERGAWSGASFVGDPVVDVAAFPLLANQTGVLEQTQMARDAGLSDAKNSCQLTDVEAVLGQDAEDAQSGAIGKQAEEVGGVLQISTNLHTVIHCSQQKCHKYQALRHFAMIRANHLCGRIAGS